MNSDVILIFKYLAGSLLENVQNIPIVTSMSNQQSIDSKKILV